MTTVTWIAFIAATIFLVVLPSPLASLTSRFARQRGRRTAFATIPAISIGLSVAFMIAAAPMLLIVLYAPGLMDTFVWTGVYLMIYVLWSFQDPSVKGPVADNDNLPETRFGRIFSCLFDKTALRPRYIVLCLAVLAQFVGRGSEPLLQLLEMQAVFALCVAVGAGVHVAFPRLRQNRVKRSQLQNPASRKPRTRFISRRAVTAGYRPIAA